MAKQGYYPVHIAATGGGTNTRISAIFEQLPAADATELTLDLNPVAAEGIPDQRHTFPRRGQQARIRRLDPLDSHDL